MKHFKSGRQAVVVIHGIGNQRPMDTLRNFVKGITTAETKLYSSPNRITDNMELRRLSLAGKKTDFYEYYWASLMQKPPFFEVAYWLLKLIFYKKPSQRLKNLIWWLRLGAIAITVGILGGLYWVNSKDIKFESKNLIMAALIFVLLRFVLPFIWSFLSDALFQNVVGDAVCYLTPSPDNVESRQRIRKNGMDLLRKLHEAKAEDDDEKNRYDKIIVVGHSLGSVIAYDILAHLWPEYNTSHGPFIDTDILKQPALDNIQAYCKNENIEADKYQAKQAELFREQQLVGNIWRISDFVTLGSPLTHGAFLLTKKTKEFEQKKDQREFAICPPQIDEQDEGFSYNTNYKVGELNRTVKVMHHAAHFAITKWNNVYFENDFVGGKLSDNFGDGIRDIPLKAKGGFTKTFPIASHTKYWERDQFESVEILKKILGI